MIPDAELEARGKEEMRLIREIRVAGPWAPGPTAWEWAVVVVVALGAAAVEWLVGGR